MSPMDPCSGDHKGKCLVFTDNSASLQQLLRICHIHRNKWPVAQMEEFLCEGSEDGLEIREVEPALGEGWTVVEPLQYQDSPLPTRPHLLTS